MSDAIRPYTLSPHRSGIAIGSDGLLYWPSGVERRQTAVIYGAGGRQGLCADRLFDSREVVIFALNNFWNGARDSSDRLRPDVWFEFHQIEPDRAGADEGHQIQDRYDMEWLRTCPVPIFVVEPFPANPRAVEWPLEYYVEKYGRRYIACTFAAQILTAFEAGFDELLVYGLDLLRGTQRERTVEASCVAYWLGYVEGRGMTVTIDDKTNRMLLNHPYVYGVDYWLERRAIEAYCQQWDTIPQAV